MKFFRRILHLFVFAFAIISLQAQSPTPKTLLWRISGNGLGKPSYLYGTMHLTDKRLFNFGDSVYKAIEKSDGLAIEINPDEIAAFELNNMLEELQARLNGLKEESPEEEEL